jgi:probable F420-dependent oxidoreductase
MVAAVASGITKIGLVVAFNGRPQRTMSDLRSVAVHAEAAGLDSLWFPEHVVFFPTYTSKYPYSEDGNPGFGKRQGVYDPLFAATVAAGVTERVRVGTAVLILPQRNPVVLAQEAVAVDHASNGRFDLGIGIGWSSEEYAALGVPWAARGKRTDEYLNVMSALWTDQLVSYRGEFTDFSDVIAEPKPIQTPLPIWVGGGNVSMRRAARYGTGWYGWNLHGDAIAAAMHELDRVCEAEGRDPSTMGRKIGLPFDGSADDLHRYLDVAAEFGVTEVVLAVGSTAAQLHERIDALAVTNR